MHPYVVTDEKRQARFVVQRALPALVGVTMFMLTTSEVQPEYLAIVDQRTAIGLQVVYGCMMLVYAIKPNVLKAYHRYAATMAAAIFVGKAIGFAELVYVDGRYNLLGPVFERLLLAFILVVWHMHRGRGATHNGDIIG